MKVVEAILNSPLMRCMGWSLVHFLWQGIAVGIIYIVLRQMLRRKSPAIRYRLAMCALAVMAIFPIFTFIYLAHAATTIATDEGLRAVSAVLTIGDRQGTTTVSSFIDRLQILLQPLIPWTVPFWLLGVCAASLRVFRGWHNVYHLRTTADFIHLKKWQSVIDSLCSLFGINKIVRLAVSTYVSVPSVVGWLKPIILIPPSVVAGLTPLQMELILAHELAHVRRQDYLWNMLQVVVETLLFYHPVVRWVSHQGRLEREQCCDDLVVELHGNSLEYARALTELECMRHPRSALMLGANGGQMFARIHRLLGVSVPDEPMFWSPLLLIAGFMIATSIGQFGHENSGLSSMLTANNPLLADLGPQVVNAPAQSNHAGLSPTRIIPAVWSQLNPSKPVPIRSINTQIESQDIPRLIQTFHQVGKKGDTPTPVDHTVATQNRTSAAIIEKHIPVYPAFAQERGVEGAATVEFKVSPEGEVINLHIVQVTGSKLFGQAAMDALRRWRFSPAREAGVPVTQTVIEEFIFQLKPQASPSGKCDIPMGYHVCTAN